MKRKSIAYLALVFALALSCAALAACGKEKGPVTYSVTVAETQNGSVTASAERAGAGEEITVTVTPDSGYKLTAGSLKYNETPISGQKFTMPAADVTISAAFEQVVTYAVTAAETAHGTITVSPQRAEAGAEITVTVTPEAGYALKEGSLKANGTAIVGGKFTMPSEAVTVTAEFVEAAVTGIEITTFPKDTYYLDERADSLDLAGLSVTAQLAGGGSKILDLAELTLSSVDLTAAGERTVTVTFGDFTDTFVVGVERRDPASVTVAATYEFDKDGPLTFADAGVTGIVGLDGSDVSFTETDGTVEVSGQTLDKGENVLRVNKADSYGFIKAIKATFVSDKAGYEAIAADLDGYYILTQNINFDGAYILPIGVTPVKLEGGSRVIDATGIGQDPATAGEDSVQVNLGVPFTGTFDGKGYALTDFKTGTRDVGYFYAVNYGKGLFNYIGETGVVKNFTLRSYYVDSGRYDAFVAGLNLGRIENVTVDKSCTLKSQYDENDAAMIAGTNVGVIENAVCYVTQYNGGVKDFGTRIAGGTGTVTRAYAAPAGEIAELTALAGWEYVEGVGTIYVNSDYVVSRPAAKEIPLGGSLKLNLYKNEGAEAVVSVWGATSVEWDGADSLTFTEGYTLAQGATFKIGVGAAGKGYTEVYDVAVSAAVPASLSSAGQIKWFKDIPYDASAVTLTLTYTDGRTESVHPTAMEGLDVAALGEQTVTFYYNDLTVTVTVNVTESSVARLTLTGTAANNIFYVNGSVTLADLAGLTLTAYDAENVPTVVALTLDMLSKTSFDTAGNEELSVTYSGVTADLGIPVVIYPAPTSVTVEFSGNPAVAYPKGGDIDWSQHVTATDNNGNPILYDRLSFGTGVLNGPVTGTFTYAYDGDRTAVSAEITVTFYYTVGSLDDWTAFTAETTGYFAQTADIDFAGVTFAPAGLAGPFDGTYDGCGFSLKNVTIADHEHAIFVTTGANAVLRRISAEKFYSTKSSSAAIARTNNGLIENCYVSGYVHESSWSAGIAVENKGTVRSCVVNGIKFTADLNNSFFIRNNTGTVDNLLVVGAEGTAADFKNGPGTNCVKLTSFNVGETTDSVFTHAEGAYTFAADASNTVSFADTVWTLAEGNALTLQRGSL